MSAARVFAGLRDVYAAPEWALLSEVRSATGQTEGLRIADVLAVNLWPSGKGHLHGIEIKVSRADAQRELRNHLKSEPFRRVCSSWWLAVPAPWKRVLLSISEVPDGWGLYEVGTGGAVEVVSAAVREPVDMTPEMTLALLRAATRANDVDAVLRISGAPSQLVTRPHLSRDRVGLACGHVATKPLTKAMPLRLPCVACAEGRPPDREMVLAAIDDASAEDLHYFAEALKARRGAA